MSDDLYLAALEYFQQGYMTIPLALDGAGFAKRPITPNWSQIPYSLAALKKLPWEEARGLGVLLGAASRNLAVLDLDDVELAEIAVKHTNHTRTVRTVRGRCHIYVRERVISRPTKFTATWHGRPVEVELKTQGQQVAAPPTPGYTLLSEAEPKEVEHIGVAWTGLARMLAIQTEPAGNGQSYPKPWQEKVVAGDRNKSAYIEAHFLRGAGMPLGLALRIMQLRWESDYEKGETDWQEISRTVESAYVKGIHVPISDVYTDIEWT